MLEVKNKEGYNQFKILDIADTDYAAIQNVYGISQFCIWAMIISQKETAREDYFL